MRYLADECCPRAVVVALRSAGRDVDWVAEKLPGADDLEVARLALETDRVLITEDYDFGELAVRDGVPMPGLIILAMHREPLRVRADRVLQVTSEFDDDLRGQIVVVEATRQRFRRLDTA